ncbi:MAG: Bug family tripartite tricarboxylate transporter substrate binding protein, partial [Egibacteraceae bacterium]
FSPGGGYDSYARMIAPYLGEELGAQVVVENQDGAGGLLAINNLVAAEPDGTRLAIMNAVGVAGGSLAGAEGIQFGLDDLSYIGRLGASYHIFATGADSAYQTFDDVLNAEGFRFGTTGPGAADFVNANLLIEMLDLDARVVSGFEGSEENELALTRGDIDGMTGDFDSRLPAIENGDHRPLLLLGPERDDAIPDTLALGELDLDEEQQELATSWYDLLQFGRPIVGPPDLPEDRLTCLRDALQATVENEELIAESEETERPINWLTGEEVDELVQSLLDAPQQFVDILTQAYAQA